MARERATPTGVKKLTAAANRQRDAEESDFDRPGRRRRTPRAKFRRIALERIAAVSPDLADPVVLRTIRALWPALDQAALPPSIKLARRIFNYARQAEAKLETIDDRDALEAVDPEAADPFADGDQWPTS